MTTPNICIKRLECEEDGVFHTAERRKANDVPENSSGAPDRNGAEVSPSTTRPQEAPLWRVRMDARASYVPGVTRLTQGQSKYAKYVVDVALRELYAEYNLPQHLDSGPGYQ
ncbi:hypothetical protein NDU88_004539 [Pleurodeles waltl]|uniref:Uncharacterized protein n=1 Tax=Pleurodeles waltl TaxID=8319 RepID=A0AAV7QIM5_PLEWA|nr:hypothetical protein NDU88_004539 [Pleurodeles waltl]